MQPDTGDDVTHPDAPTTEPAPEDQAEGRLRRLFWRSPRPTTTPPRHEVDVVARQSFRLDNAQDLLRLWPAIVGAFGGVLAIAFVMSYHGLYVLGREIMRWPVALYSIAPIGLDVLSMVGLLATFIVRDAPWRVRAYMWAMFGSTVALSVVGNAVAAVAASAPVAGVSLDPADWEYRQVVAAVGAAVWPAAAAAALHALIVVRRHLDRIRDKIKEVSQAAARAEAEDALLQARAITLAVTGATVSDILAAIDADESQRRTIERCTKPVRDALTASRNGHAAKPTTRNRT